MVTDHDVIVIGAGWRRAHRVPVRSPLQLWRYCSREGQLHLRNRLGADAEIAPVLLVRRELLTWKVSLSVIRVASIPILILLKAS